MLKWRSHCEKCLVFVKKMLLGPACINRPQASSVGTVSSGFLYLLRWTYSRRITPPACCVFQNVARLVRIRVFHLSGSSSSSLVHCCVLLSGTLGGLFSQILQGEDIVRERAIKFLSAKLKTLPEDVMTKEVEDYIFAEAKKVGIQCGRVTCSESGFVADCLACGSLFGCPDVI